MCRGSPAAGGFGAVPSEFSPEFLVAFDGTNLNQLDCATRVVADIAQRTGSVLTPRVVDVNDEADAGTGALIVANSAKLEPTSLRPPIGGNSAETSADLRDELRADIARGLGSIQAFADQSRDRTVIRVPPAERSRWWSHCSATSTSCRTAGRALTAMPRSPAPGQCRQPVDRAGTPPQDADGLPVWLLISAGCAVEVALVLGSALGWRRRRKTG